MKLDFLRTEKILSQENQSSSMTGTVIYNKNPFVFIFQIKSPAVQTMYVNDQGAYIFDQDSIYEISENRDFLEQTCRDFLNWFKEDYGLAESFFRPIDKWLEEAYVVSEWACYKNQDQPLNKVLVYSDSQGRFTRLKMYANENNLITDTRLSVFYSSVGYSYPTIIDSISYDQDQAFLQTSLKFSKVSFALTDQDQKQIQAFAEQTRLFTAQLPAADLSQSYDIQKLVSPAALSYKVSIPSVLVGASFNFYKKFITSQDMSNCPFYPTCSQFMLQAVQANGIFGVFQGIERLRRCTSTEHKRDLYVTLSNGKHDDPVPVMKKSK